MKYIKKILILSAMLIALEISAVYAVEGTITTDGVRVRKGPSTDTAIVTSLNKNAKVEILEETNGWYKIIYTATGNFEGYIRKDLVMASGPIEAMPGTPVPTIEPTIAPTDEPGTIETPAQTEKPKVNLLGDRLLSSESNIYILPALTSSVKDTAKKNTQVLVLEVAGNFAYIKYGNNYGWVRVESLQETKTKPQPNNTGNTTQQTERVGYINVTQAIVRQSATTASAMVTALNLNSEVTIIGEENDFYKVRINGSECYIAKRLISNTKTTTNRSDSSRQEQAYVPTESIPTAIPQEEGTTVASSVGEQIASMAKSYLGYKYVYGGSSPTTGFDCSGLTYYICGRLGYSINRTADNQANNGVYVAKENLQPGDLVFFSDFKTHKGIGHVGIYIGNGKFVHASTPTKGVIESSLNQGDYVVRYVTARRIGI